MGAPHVPMESLYSQITVFIEVLLSIPRLKGVAPTPIFQETSSMWGTGRMTNPTGRELNFMRTVPRTGGIFRTARKVDKESTSGVMGKYTRASSEKDTAGAKEF